MPIAIQMTRYGAPSVMEAIEVPIPEPVPGEVVVKVAASAVNRADCEIRSGKWKILRDDPFPHTPGLETCGTVHAVGIGVTAIAPGAPVITMMQKLGGIHGVRPGGYQAYVKVPASTLATFPADIDPVQLAAVGLAGVTAYHGITKLALSPGETVIVNGASGGVGSLAVMLAKAAGAHVVAPTNRPEKAAALMALGADEIWDVREGFSAYASRKVDAVLEMVGGETFRACVAMLRPRGRLCSIGALTGGEASLSVWDLLHELTLTGWSSEDMDRDGLQRSVDELAKLLAAKRLQPPPYRVYPLAEAARAHEDMEAGRFAGRLLLVP